MMKNGNMHRDYHDLSSQRIVTFVEDVMFFIIIFVLVQEEEQISLKNFCRILLEAKQS